METLVLDGKSYVKASKAARDLGYASDYVGQLCRSGKVTAHLIGRTWYVNPDELTTHRVEKKRMSRIKAREQAHKSIAEHRIKISNATNNYKNIGIQYETDAEELIPHTKKLSVQTEVVRNTSYDDESDSGHQIINKGEKTMMSGSVKVMDVTDGVIDAETTVLVPKAIKKQQVKEISKGVFGIGTFVTDSEGKNTHQTEDLSKKLTVTDTSDEKVTSGVHMFEHEVNVQTKETVVMPETNQGSRIPYVITTCVVLILAILSVPTFITVKYTNNGAPVAVSEYNFSLSQAVALLKLKI